MTDTIEVIANALRYDRFNPNIPAEEIAAKVVAELELAMTDTTNAPAQCGGMGDLIARAELLRANTVKLRFFKGATYDGGADEYLRQLTVFIDDVLPALRAASLPPQVQGEPQSSTRVQAEDWRGFAEVGDTQSNNPQPSAATTEPVAWRWKPKGAALWIYNPEAEWLADQDVATIDVEPLYAAPPEPSAVSADPETWRCFDTTGTIFQRTGKVLSILCESDEIANRAADQLRTKPAPQPSAVSTDAVASEREHCAKIADPWPGFPTEDSADFKLSEVDKAVIQVRKDIAATIRSRVGETP